MSKYSENERRRLIERGIVRALIGHMQHKGFAVFRTYDGEQFEYPASTAAAMAACFNLDEVSLRFVPRAVRAEIDKVRGSGDCAAVKRAGEAGKHAEHGVLLVMGNGEDIVSDWGYSNGDPDGFNAAMESFSAEDGERYGRDMHEVGMRSATDADRVAVLAGPWLREGDALAVLFKGRDGLRKVGEVQGVTDERAALSAADTILGTLRLSAERLSIAEVDAYPGGWRKRAIVATA